jgi:hypothetical protein
VRLFRVCALLCAGSGLAQADPPSKEFYRLCKKITTLKSDQGPAKGCRAFNIRSTHNRKARGLDHKQNTEHKWQRCTNFRHKPVLLQSTSYLIIRVERTTFTARPLSPIILHRKNVTKVYKIFQNINNLRLLVSKI